MSFCVPCTLLKPVSLCTDSLIIGTMPAANTHYKVNFKSVSTGAIFSYPAQSDSDRLLTLTLTDGMPLANGQYYEMTVSTTGNLNDVQAIFIGTTEAECYLFIAEIIYDIYYSDFVNFSSQTLEVYAT